MWETLWGMIGLIGGAGALAQPLLRGERGWRSGDALDALLTGEAASSRAGACYREGAGGPERSLTIEWGPAILGNNYFGPRP